MTATELASALIDEVADAYEAENDPVSAFTAGQCVLLRHRANFPQMQWPRARALIYLYERVKSEQQFARTGV